MSQSRRKGILLLNLGTPAAPEPGAVRRYLAEFLSDPRVLDMPALSRWLLLHAVILPFRPRRSAQAYAKIWGPEGSPLLVHSRALQEALAKTLGGDFVVELAMRYGKPSIPEALARLVAGDLSRIVVLPLFPQYASSSGGSAAQAVMAAASAMWNVPALELLGEFHDDLGFLDAWMAVAAPELASFAPDHVLFSYHGLPERQVRKSDPGGRHCLVSAGCCERLGPANRRCYRAQCFATTRALAAGLTLRPSEHSTAFQSRLGRTPWIRPFTDEVLPELAGRGVRRLAVLCPSFVADCLETVEEIGLRAREQWQSLGGEELLLVPSLNEHPAWVQAVARILQPLQR